MTKAPLTILAVATLVAVAGCAKKKPAELPPPPPTSTTVPSDTNTPPNAGGAGLGNAPGSRADFLARAGTDTVYFGTDSYEIDEDSRRTLTAQSEWLKQYANVAITIEGHCDERGTREYNLALGDRRANAAKNFLVAAGISPSRISVISYGKERPAALGSDEASWQQNRRAVTVVPQ